MPKVTPRNAALARRATTRVAQRKTTAYYVDRLGEINAQIAELSEEKARIEERLKGKAPASYEGQNFVCTVFTRTTKAFDFTKAKRLLKEKYDKCWKTGEVVSLKITEH